MSDKKSYHTDLHTEPRAMMNNSFEEMSLKCITFDKKAQDNLPEHIKAKMKSNQEKAKFKKENSMSDKKIFIALSQREARLVLTAVQLVSVVCSNQSIESLEFNTENAKTIGISASEFSELMYFALRLEQLANEQAELEATINAAEPETLN